MNPNEQNTSIALEIVKASEIEPKEVNRLWYPYIPFGKVTPRSTIPATAKAN